MKIEEERSFVIATLNVGTMTARGREAVDVMERRKIDVLCVQEVSCTTLEWIIGGME